MSLSLPQLQAAIAEWVAENFPGRTPKRILIVTDQDDKPLSLPVAVPLLSLPGSTVTRHTSAAPAAAEAPAAGGFTPSDYQLQILDALEYRALRTEELAGEVGGDRRRIFRRPGGIHELREHGLIKNDRRLGYYRPDAPPAELNGGADAP